MNQPVRAIHPLLNGARHIPKITILTPTRRPHYLEQCRKYIERQTYPRERLEWVIVNSSGQDIQVPLIEGMRVGVVHAAGPLGSLRNTGLRVAVGDLVAHYDDDDWQAPDRIERQALPFLVSPSLQLVCTDDYHILRLEVDPPKAHRSWSWGYEAFASGGTFMYRRAAWIRHPFSPIQIGEDNLFARVFRREASTSVRNLRDPSIFVCVRHRDNTNEVDTSALEARQPAVPTDWIQSMVGDIDWQQMKLLANFSGEKKESSRKQP
jgi:glycosyltransferase involved in cell wall biosynthesis